MKLLRLLGTLCLCTALSQSASAALIDADWMSSNDNLITTDTVSKLSWLDITVTAGLSRDEVLTQMETGGSFYGFRYATSTEVIDLWGQYGITLFQDIQTVTSGFLDPKIITASQQLGNLYGQAVSSSDYGTIGFIAIDPDSPSTTTGWTGAYRQNGNSYYEGPTNTSLLSVGSKPWLGSYVVTTVPVPAAFWLFASGLLGLIGIARKKSV